jgi:hypothetical protein
MKDKKLVKDKKLPTVTLTLLGKNHTDYELKTKLKHFSHYVMKYKEIKFFIFHVLICTICKIHVQYVKFMYNM